MEVAVREHPLATFLAGAAVAIAATFFARLSEPYPALAQAPSSGGGDGFVMTSSGNFDNRAQDLLWVLTPGLPADPVNPESRPGPRLLCYEVDGPNLRLLQARNLLFDMQVDQFSAGRDGDQTPTVNEVRAALLPR